MYINIMHTYIYIHIERERERDRVYKVLGLGSSEYAL